MPQARDPGLVGGVLVGRPLQDHGLGRTVLEFEVLVLVGDERAHAAGEELASGQPGHHLGRGAAERAVPRYVAGERRRDEGVSLVREPHQGPDPSDPARFRLRIVGDAVPAQHGDLTLAPREVFVSLSRGRRLERDHLDQAGHQR